MAKILTPAPVGSLRQRKEDLAKRLEYERERDKQLIKGIFNYHECPGGVLRFSFYKYKGDGVDKYELKDGETYSLPLGVVNHLNKNCAYPVHAHATDENGKPYVRIGQMVKRCSFSNFDFMLEDMMPPEKQLVTVEYLNK